MTDSANKMEEEVLADLEGISVSEGESIYGQHPRYSKYKNLGKIQESQRQRRTEHLDRQKNKRDEHANKLRALYEDEDEEEEGQRKGAYADCLMFSEWLVDIPGTLSTDWVMMPCPEGRRCLVVATKVGSM
ncbi:nucleolar RNA-associated protein alpha [Aphelenchoides avenae]|nr:nucleolar RNA-associated protein alpha [Aphelenchus avenae]